VLDAAREHRASVLYGAPYQYALLAAEASQARIPSLRLAVSTAAALSEGTAREFLGRFGLPLTQALGIIEVGLPVMNRALAREKPASVGRPLPGFSLELRDEEGERVPAGEVGEVHVRGPGMLDAYLSPWRLREEIAPGGWFSTGDLGRIDADGDLWLVGRSRSVVNVAGLKCFPEEVEAVLLEHPAVRAARVVPKPHPRIGAVPVAEVVPRDPAEPPSEASLAAHCRARLARFKVPVEFHLVENVSTTPSGKVRRV
jgi:acyl-coenzyme A synthetase/AMP-(fatty) acid ligase